LRKFPAKKKKPIEKIKLDCTYDIKSLKVINVTAPTRWNRQCLALESASVIIAGGHGMVNKDNFAKLFELAELLKGDVGATRIPVFNKWCDEERLIGQTGKVVRPDLYIGFGISGQIQHTMAILDAKRIISINNDKDAALNEMSDYIITEDATEFLTKLIARIKQEKKNS
jgi:electron transfer flavoprotein alpha subunit